jgi:hypothetical protein
VRCEHYGSATESEFAMPESAWKVPYAHRLTSCPIWVRFGSRTAFKVPNKSEEIHWALSIEELKSRIERWDKKDSGWKSRGFRFLSWHEKYHFIISCGGLWNIVQTFPMPSDDRLQLDWNFESRFSAPFSTPAKPHKRDGIFSSAKFTRLPRPPSDRHIDYLSIFYLDIHAHGA